MSVTPDWSAHHVLGAGTAELNRIESALAAGLVALCDEWERVHGDH